MPGIFHVNSYNPSEQLYEVVHEHYFHPNFTLEETKKLRLR